MISSDIICSSWQVVVIYLIFQIAVIQRCSYEEDKATKYANVKVVVGINHKLNLDFQVSVICKGKT